MRYILLLTVLLASNAFAAPDFDETKAAAEPPFIVTVSAQTQSRLDSRVLHYPQASFHYCTNVPVLYSNLSD